MKIVFSFVIPVYNRPEEIKRLLLSFEKAKSRELYEIIVIDDGSTPPCGEVVSSFAGALPVKYFYKPNSGPGDSRNFGVERALGDYVVFMDSDCTIPPDYLEAASAFAKTEAADCFGGRDTSDGDFTQFQKAVNHALTSFLTTGGIRGSKRSKKNFQPRSFNMIVRKSVFAQVGGFRNIHPGEDPDLAIRIRKEGFKTAYSEGLFVYHHRRIDLKGFVKQMYKFGMARAVLNHWHPESRRLSYWFPVIFSMGAVVSFITLKHCGWVMLGMGFYLSLVMLSAVATYKSLVVGVLSVVATVAQFFAYAAGFLYGTIKLYGSRQSPEETLPQLFFIKK